MRKVFIGITYISSWILGSLALASLINLGLIQSGVFSKGDSAETIVFALSGLLALGGASSLYKEAFPKEQLEKKPETPST